MLYIQLFWEFLKIGFFAVGGGMVAIPFLQELGTRTGWYEQSLITDMIAISESTPGPIGINMATYVGNILGGIPGGIIATLGEITPSIIIVIVVSKVYESFKSNPIVERIFYGLRPVVAGLVGGATISIMSISFLDGASYSGLESLLTAIQWHAILYYAIVLALLIKTKKSPVVFIGLSIVVGVLFKM